MATGPKLNNPEVFPTEGMDLRSLDKSAGTPYVLNMIPRNGESRVRPGFGVVHEFGTTLNNGRNAPGSSDTTYYGLHAPIGSFPIRTSFGHDQIVSVHAVDGFNGNFANSGGQWGGTTIAPDWKSQTQGGWFLGVSVVIHDVTTGRFQEFVLHEQDTQEDDLRNTYPHYSSRFNKDNAKWVVCPYEPQWAIFTQIGTNVIIAIDGLGLFYYRPTDPAIGAYDTQHAQTKGGHQADPQGSRQVDSINQDVVPSWKGETSPVSPLHLHDGILAGEILADGQTLAYLRPISEFGNPQAMCVLGQRMAYAVGNTVWFSDPNTPNEILTDSSLTLPTTDPITLLAQVRGSLVCCTQFRSWLFNPNEGGNFITGSLVDLAVGIGCKSNQAYAVCGDTLFFNSLRGIYAYGGGLEVQWASESIDRLWTDKQSLQLPLTDYFTANGYTAGADPQPPSRIDIPNQNFKLVWQEERKTLYAVGRDVTLLYTMHYGWHTWQFLTHAHTTGIVRGTNNLKNPIIVPIRERLFMVGGTDNFAYFQSEPFQQVRDSSCYLLEMGRGGALDKSVDTPNEDAREPLGGWQLFIDQGAAPGFWVGKPITMPIGYRTLEQTFGFETVWFPFYISDPGFTNDNFIQFDFLFDNVNWSPVFRQSNTTYLDVIWPAEHTASRFGWGHFIPTPTQEIQCYQGALTDPNGNTIHCRFNGTGLPALWNFQPTIVLEPKERNLVVWLPFQRRPPNTASVLQLGIDPQNAIIGLSAGVQRDANVWLWQQGTYPAQELGLNQQTQCVDWAMKSTSIHTKNYEQIKIHGVYLRVQSFGNSPSDQVANWPIGPVNTTTSTDYKDWSAQLVDYGALIPPGGTTQQLGIINPRARLLPSLTAAMVQKVGNAGARWGDVGNAALGNLLVDDAATDTLATSDGSRGESASIMPFGTMNNQGEGVAISSIQPMMVTIGGRRRVGRQ